MATYYKYAERQADSFVNWAEIGKDITDMLKTETSIREEKKAAIDKASREYGEQLANAPTGEHIGANAWTLAYASDAQQARLLQDRLLKSGGLSVKDYTIMRQNLNDGTSQLFNLSKEYQEEFKLKMDRLKSADPTTRSQDLEVFLMETAEGFANFTKSKPLINPTDFSVSIGIMEPDPNNQGVLRLTDQVETVNYLRNRIKAQYDYFDSTKATDEISGGMNQYIVATKDADALNGIITTTADALARPGAEKYLETKAKAYLENPYNISSVLTNDIGTHENGKEYTYSFTDKSGANVIFLERDPVSGMANPIYTDEQKKSALDYLIGETKQKIAYEQKLNPYTLQQRQVVSGGGSGPRPQANAVSLWMDVYSSANVMDKLTAKNALLATEAAKDNGVIDIKFDKDGAGNETISFINSDPAFTTRPVIFRFANGTAVSPDAWAAMGAEVTGETDKRKLQQAASGRNFFDITSGANTWGAQIGATFQGATDFIPAATEALNAGITADLFNQSSAKTAPALQTILGKAGFTVTDTGGPFANSMEVLASGETVPLLINSTEPADRQKLIDWVTAKLTQSRAEKLSAPV
jgi:hypothetical protein